MAALKAMKSGNTLNEIASFRLKQEEQRSAELERELKAVRARLREQEQLGVAASKQPMASESVEAVIARDFEEMLSVDHGALFGVLSDLMVSHRRTWNGQFIEMLIHELLFNVLAESFAAVQRFEGAVSLALCKELGINRAILSESFYSEWTERSKHHIFLHSADRVGALKSAVTDGLFMEQFMARHLGLKRHQIPQQIHFEFASFLTKCIDLSWRMSVRSPALQFTPSAFRPDAAKKAVFYEDLHRAQHGDDAAECILYFIWPIITENGFHSVADGMKIAVCLGDAEPTKLGKDGGSGHDEDGDGGDGGGGLDEMSVDREESVGAVIFSHDPDDDQYQGAALYDDDDHLHEAQFHVDY